MRAGGVAQWATMLVIEQMQRWRCHSYNPRTTVVAPYSSTEVIAALPDATKTQFLFFRWAPWTLELHPRTLCALETP